MNSDRNILFETRIPFKQGVDMGGVPSLLVERRRDTARGMLVGFMASHRVAFLLRATAGHRARGGGVGADMNAASCLALPFLKKKKKGRNSFSFRSPSVTENREKGLQVTDFFANKSFFFFSPFFRSKQREPLVLFFFSFCFWFPLWFS